MWKPTAKTSRHRGKYVVVAKAIDLHHMLGMGGDGRQSHVREVTVQSGDTLYGLARRVGSDVEAIRRANPHDVIANDLVLVRLLEHCYHSCWVCCSLRTKSHVPLQRALCSRPAVWLS